MPVIHLREAPDSDLADEETSKDGEEVADVHRHHRQHPAPRVSTNTVFGRKRSELTASKQHQPAQ